MPVTTVLSELADKLIDYDRIRTCVAGSRFVKAKRYSPGYLPIPDPDEPDDTKRTNRYNSYLDRAVFYGVTGRTLRGLVGLVYDKDPAVQIPALMQPLLADIDGAGLSIDQHSQRSLRDVVSLGRGGLFTDYPQTLGPTTRAQALGGNIRPTVTYYKPEDIINWRTRTIGGKVQPCLVVMKYREAIEDDGFSESFEDRYRVLRLDDGNRYTIEIWREGDGEAPAPIMPLDGRGQPFMEIPFEFMGSTDNSPAIDDSPLLDIAELNLAHFRNSADYEESTFMVGQPTPVFAGLTKDWVQNVLKNEVRLGSRGAVSLPQGGSADLLQAEPNTMVKEAMEHKEAQMIALGAKLIENTGTQQTATEATLDTVLDNSVLATCARNVSSAYRRSLGWAWQYMTGEIVENPEVIDYALNTDFAARMLTAAERSEIVAEWTKGAISFEEMRWNLKRSGTAYLDDAIAQAQIDQEREKSIEFEAKAAEAVGSVGANDED